MRRRRACADGRNAANSRDDHDHAGLEPARAGATRCRDGDPAPGKQPGLAHELHGGTSARRPMRPQRPQLQRLREHWPQTVGRYPRQMHRHSMADPTDIGSMEPLMIDASVPKRAASAGARPMRMEERPDQRATRRSSQRYEAPEAVFARCGHPADQRARVFVADRGTASIMHSESGTSWKLPMPEKGSPGRIRCLRRRCRGLRHRAPIIAATGAGHCMATVAEPCPKHLERRCRAGRWRFVGSTEHRIAMAQRLRPRRHRRSPTRHGVGVRLDARRIRVGARPSADRAGSAGCGREAIGRMLRAVESGKVPGVANCHRAAKRLGDDRAVADARVGLQAEQAARGLRRALGELGERRLGGLRREMGGEDAAHLGGPPGARGLRGRPRACRARAVRSIRSRPLQPRRERALGSSRAGGNWRSRAHRPGAAPRPRAAGRRSRRAAGPHSRSCGSSSPWRRACTRRGALGSRRPKG